MGEREEIEASAKRLQAKTEKLYQIFKQMADDLMFATDEQEAQLFKDLEARAYKFAEDTEDTCVGFLEERGFTCVRK